MSKEEQISLTTLDLEQETEGVDLEAKLAGGKDGRGDVPRSVFETYSAMANTDGGVILLGVRELPGNQLEAAGIKDVAKVQKELWDALNSPQKISNNILTASSVRRPPGRRQANCADCRSAS